MFTGTALSVRLFVCAGLSLFIICGPYLSVVVCVFYAYNLTVGHAQEVRVVWVAASDPMWVTLFLVSPGLLWG